MDKHLVQCDEEYVALFKDMELQDAENMLGVEFAFADGTYDEGDGTKTVSRTMYRKRSYKNAGDLSNFPKEYPCVVLLTNEKGFDRLGDLHIQVLEFAYISDFIHAVR